MNILIIVNIILSFTASGIFFYCALKILRIWYRYREEMLIHLSALFVYISLIVIAFGILLTSEINFSIDPSMLGLLGAFYGLFYLEYSLFYLSLFSNSKNIIEKYFTVIIGMTIILNLITVFIQIKEIVQLTFLINVAAILSGLYLVAQTYNKFKQSEKYLHKEQNKKFVRFIQKVSAFVFLLLLFDGIGFMSFWIWNYMITDVILIILPIILISITLSVHYISKKAIVKARACDMTSLLNNL